MGELSLDYYVQYVMTEAQSSFFLITKRFSTKLFLMTLSYSPIYLSLAEGVIKVKKSTFIKILLILFVIPVFSFNPMAKEELIKSQWLSSIVNIDGSLEDWAEIGVYLDKRVMTECALRNNNETLFILFVLKDRKYFSTIQSSGLTIWFNSDGTKKKNDGLNFLKKMIAAADYINELEQQKSPLSEEDKTKILVSGYSAH